MKPEGWLDDELEFVPDPNAEKPEDWSVLRLSQPLCWFCCLFITSACFSVCRDEEMDGEWEAPQVPNPACETAPGCGDWKRPMINNPQYKGKWKAPLIDNPNYQVRWF